jgi:hypothetical protein
VDTRIVGVTQIEIDYEKVRKPEAGDQAVEEARTAQ